VVAKIHQALQPGIAEMFFARIPVLVEGLEDVSYLTTQLHLSGLWSEFRRLGCHVIPANGKDKLIQPLAIAIELGLPVFVVFDADGNFTKPEHRVQHERDNQALMSLLGVTGDSFPQDNIIGDNHAIWPTNLTDVVKADYPPADYSRITDAARRNYAQEASLGKNHLFIADWVSAAKNENLESLTLGTLCQSIIQFARNEEQP
jgi:predicted ATP-dependent endonuclease of OLD family